MSAKLVAQVFGMKSKTKLCEFSSKIKYINILINLYQLYDIVFIII